MVGDGVKRVEISRVLHAEAPAVVERVHVLRPSRPNGPRTREIELQTGGRRLTAFASQRSGPA